MRTSRRVATRTTTTTRGNRRSTGAAFVVVPRANVGGGESNADGFTNADAFAALSGLKKTANDPFATGGARGRPTAPVGPSVGFVKAGVDVVGFPSTRDADAILKRLVAEIQANDDEDGSEEDDSWTPDGTRWDENPEFMRAAGMSAASVREKYPDMFTSERSFTGDS